MSIVGWVGLAERQHGVLSRDQAKEASMTPAALHARIKRGALMPCGSRAVHLPGTVLTWYGRLTAGLLDLGPETLVSGRAAAQLHGLDGFDVGAVEFLVPRSIRDRKTPGDVTSSSDIGLGDRVMVGGFPRTSPTCFTHDDVVADPGYVVQTLARALGVAC